MDFKKKYCVVRNEPIYTMEGAELRLKVIKEFENLDQITAYYREENEGPNENHPLWPAGARVIEMLVSASEPFINI